MHMNSTIVIYGMLKLFFLLILLDFSVIIYIGMDRIYIGAVIRMNAKEDIPMTAYSTYLKVYG